MAAPTEIALQLKKEKKLRLVRSKQQFLNDEFKALFSENIKLSFRDIYFITSFWDNGNNPTTISKRLKGRMRTLNRKWREVGLWLQFLPDPEIQKDPKYGSHYRFFVMEEADSKARK